MSGLQTATMIVVAEDCLGDSWQELRVHMPKA